jgi:hypothetical protein
VLVRRLAGFGTGPLPEAGLDQSLGLVIGLGRVGHGPSVCGLQLLTGVTEELEVVSNASFGHRALVAVDAGCTEVRRVGD